MKTFKKNSMNNSTFYSTTLTPQKRKQISQFLDTSTDQTVFNIALDVKKRLINSANKGIKSRNKKKDSSMKKYSKQADNDKSTCIIQTELFNKSTQNPQNINNYRQDQNQVRLDIINEKKLLYKVTIHRIKSQRDEFEKQIQHMENSYKYMIQKFNQNKKKNSIEKKLSISRQKIIQESQKKKQQFSKEIKLHKQETLLQKSRLRQSVIKHKFDKNQSITNLVQKKKLHAQKVKRQSQQIQSQLKQNRTHIYNKNKQLHGAQLKEERQRQIRKKNSLLEKKKNAQQNFKNKWLEEFGKSSKARITFYKKKQMLSKKMQYVLNDFRQEESQSIMRKYSTPKAKRSDTNLSMQQKYRSVFFS